MIFRKSSMVTLARGTLCYGEQPNASASSLKNILLNTA
jgi:hypothetical protein